MNRNIGGSLLRSDRPVGRPRFRRWVVFGLVGALLATSASDGARAMPAGAVAAEKASKAKHKARPAPVQRWGSAAGKSHLVGESGNRTVPPSLRSQYPLHTFDTAPTKGRNTASVAKAPANVAKGFDRATSREIPGARSAHQRVYDNADGSQTTEFSTAPVNVKQSDGSWKPVERVLSAVPGGWRSGDGAGEVRLAGRADASELAQVRVDAEHTVGFAMAGVAPVTGVVESDGNTVTYPQVMPQVDLRLHAAFGRVKETLVLHSADAPHSYVFPLRLGGLSARVDGTQVVLTDRSGKQRAVIPAGSMVDSGVGASGPATTAGVTYELVPDGGGQALRVSLDSAWLRDPARTYPVQMDPTVGPPVERGAADSAMVVRGATKADNPSDLWVGRTKNGDAASYIRFGGLVDRLHNHTIFGAQLQVVNYNAASCQARQVSVHPVTGAWESSSGYPGPAVGPALAQRSFAHGYIPVGQSRSACPAAGELFDLGDAGTALVQRWVNGEQGNHGLSLRAGKGDESAWKTFAGMDTANAPTLYVTHSEYNASYEIPKPVPDPAVLQNQAGKVNVTVTNLSAQPWAPGDYHLAYRAYTADKGEPFGQQWAAGLPGAVQRGGKVTLEATIKPLPPGRYFLDFTMVRTGGAVFTDRQVPPGRIVLEIIDIAPVVQEVFPPNGHQAPTLTPQLWARASDIDAPPNVHMQYRYEICDQDAAGKPVGCTTSGDLGNPAWSVPTGRLKWSKSYLWRGFVKDAGNEAETPYSTLIAAVPQPEITSRIAAAPYGTQDKEFDAQIGNFTTAAVDAAPTVNASPDLSVVRTYNSLDPRRDGAFGAGWTTRYDMRLVEDRDGSGNVVVTYGDGQQVRFGYNPADKTYTAPLGRTASLTIDGLTWKLRDKSSTVYQFSAGGLLMSTTAVGGHTVKYSRNPADETLMKAQVANSQTNQAGRSLTFTWTNKRITKVSTDPVDGAPLSWTYSYTGDRLTKVCAPDTTTCTTYEYGTGSHYRTSVFDAKPESYWRFGEKSGTTTAASEVAVNLGQDAGKYTAVTLGAPGALADADNTAATFNGTSSVVELPNGTLKKSRDAAVEMWFKVPATSTGGPLLGYQDTALGSAPGNGVPVLYVGTDRRVHGQFATGTINPIVSANAVGAGWHHVVLSASGGVQTLYLDGVASTNPLLSGVDHTPMRFNQIGTASVSTPGAWAGWGSAPRRTFNGVIDEVAIYSHPLSAATVAGHVALGRNAADSLTKVTLPSGRVSAEVAYDVNLDRVKQYTDRHGGTYKIGAPTVYGSDKDLRRSVQVLDPANRPSLYEYDALAGRLLRSGTPLGLEIRDEDVPKPTGSPTPTSSPSPTKVCSKPDANEPGFCTIIPGGSSVPVFVRHTLDGMAIRSFSYDEKGFQNVTTNENGDTVTMTFDDRGNVTSRKTCRTSEKDCNTAYWTYPAVVTDPYNPTNDLPLTHRDGRSTSATDPNYVTRYEYHPLTGKLTRQTNPDGSSVSHLYTSGAPAVGGGTTPSGLPMTTTDARGKIIKYEYYPNGDLARVTKPSGLITESVYDALGRSVSQKETSDTYPLGLVTTFTYDWASRLKTVTEPATTDAVTGQKHQRRTSNTYDADGNLVEVAVSDLLGGGATRTTKMEYDAHGRQNRVVDAEDNETTYEYDRFGNRTSTVDANENRYDYAYTARNALAEVRLRAWNGDPKGSGDPTPGADYLVLHSYSYDHAGRMASDTDAMGRRIEFEYYRDDLLKKTVLKDFRKPDGSTRDYVIEEVTYDGAGHKIKQVGANGTMVIETPVDKAGKVASTVVDPGGLHRTSTFTHDGNGNVLTSTVTGRSSNLGSFNANRSEVVRYTYDDAGNMTTQAVVGDGATRVTGYTYDKRGLLISTTDPRGTPLGADKAAYTTKYSYDELGRRFRVTAPAVAAESGGGATQVVEPTSVVGYNAFDEPVATRDPLGNVSRTEYDKLGRAVAAFAPTYTPPGGSPVTPSTRTRYDGLGNPLEVVDPRGNVTRYEYDRLNRVMTLDAPATSNDERAVSRYTYTRTGEVLSATGPTGARVETTYDDLDRKVTVTQVERHPVPDTFTTRFNYDDAGNVTSVVSPSGSTTTNVYDAVGALTQTVDPAKVSHHFGYDFAGRKVRSTDGLGRASTVLYDDFGRAAAESTIAPDGKVLRTQQYGYDEVGNLTSATDDHKRIREYAYNALNQLVRQVEPVSDAASITTSFGYDAAGNRTRYTDGRGNVTTSTVNTLGLPESVIEPSTTTHPNVADRTWTVAYNEAGQGETLTAPGGVVRKRDFDAAGRLRKETGAGGETATAERSMAYDPAGRLTTVNALDGTDTYTYNDRGALLTARGPSGSGTFGYDDDGRLTSREDAAGTATFGYTEGRLATITDALTKTRQTVGYDAAGQVDTIDYGAGRVRTYGYDEYGRVQSDTLRNAMLQTVASVTYGYDSDNRLTSKVTTGVAGAGTNTYGYDHAGRLTSWTGPSGTTEYGWDNSGNRTKAGAKTASYDERNRLLGDGDYTYAYTARGTLKSRTSSGLSDQYSFDAFDRLVNSAGQNYTYDGLDRVASRNGTTLTYADQGDSLISDGAEIYARGPSDELMAVGDGAKKRLTLADRHGDVVAALDPADQSLAAPAASTTYDPFGQVTARAGDTGNLGYQGDWTDPNTGQIDMGARWYDPASASFTSRDSAGYTGGQSILANRYTYGGGDPMNATDPDGHWPKWVKNVGNAISSTVSTAVNVMSYAASYAASYVSNWVSAAASYAWSALKAVGSAIVETAKVIVNKAATVIQNVGKAISKARTIVSNGANWAKQKATEIKVKAVAQAKRATAVARHAVAQAIKHTPLAAIAAAAKPLLNLKSMVSALASIPAKIVSTVRDVVHDTNRAVQAIYTKAVEAAGPIVDNLSKAVTAATNYVESHKAQIAGFAAGLVVGVGCAALIGWTGVGAVACGALAGAVGSIVSDMVEGGKGWKEMLGNAALGGAIGGLTGGLGSIGGQALSAGLRGLGGGAGSALTQAGGAARAEISSIASGRLSGGALSGAGRSGASRVGGSCVAGNSFAAGTAVLVKADGTSKPINEITEGETVLATDPTTGRTETKTVEKVITGSGQKHLVEITIATGDATSPKVGTVTATDEHPFWVPSEHRWVNAKDLEPGYTVQTADHRPATVVTTRAWTEYETVYNLTVDDIHTYYVVAGDTSVLVHNCGGLPDNIKALSEAHITDSGDTVLGHFPGYIDKAGARGASYYDIGDAWNGLSDSQRWAANTNFLDRVTARGDRVLLSLPKNQIRPGSYLEMEVNYLTQERGYGWVNQWSLRPKG
ncbi:MAG TPA: RHS repeat-associated core domain-containing protein [Micromonosporaceae bacterium]|nr:RHS repeat-associated core domain-containing protein [Micromonosporaceae bacterium]